MTRWRVDEWVKYEDFSLCIPYFFSIDGTIIHKFLKKDPLKLSEENCLFLINVRIGFDVGFAIDCCCCFDRFVPISYHKKRSKCQSHTEPIASW